MEILQIYEAYKQMSKNLEEYLQSWVEDQREVEKLALQETMKQAQTELEELLSGITNEMEQMEEEQNIKDLKYLMMDMMFLITDLIHFSHYDEMGRCKMRATNYLGKRRRAEVSF